MLVLFETAAGIAIVKKLPKYFVSSNRTLKAFELKAFIKFENISHAVLSSTSILKYEIPNQLKRFMKKHLHCGEQLGVSDPKLGNVIKKKCGIKCIFSGIILGWMRDIRTQLERLIPQIVFIDLHHITLGLSHSLSQHGLKSLANKVDIILIQAVGLIDDFDKYIDIYSVKVKECYGWHFPEMEKILSNSIIYLKTVRILGDRYNLTIVNLSNILQKSTILDMKKFALESLGKNLYQEDIFNIQSLCNKIISLYKYRKWLEEYIKNRMKTISPNLTAIVGEIIGVRLITGAGSLLDLAKLPASVLQVLGAEKALFRALETIKNTPKYGLIYHASFVKQSPRLLRGKISRILAAKSSLSIRVDALGEYPRFSQGIQGRNMVNIRLRYLKEKNRNVFKKCIIDTKQHQVSMLS